MTENYFENKQAAILRKFFIKWHSQCRRDFPWRNKHISPYGVLIAEMMLRQTRAEMVADVWPAFIDSYPSPLICSSASESALFERVKWLGLGHQRARALRDVCAALVGQHKGEVPRSIAELLALPHVGLYAANAVACFAFGEKVPIVDGNVHRIFSRLTGKVFGTDPRRGKGKIIWNYVNATLPSRFVREHNYGVLDFSAQICTPRTPACEKCPLAPHCVTGSARVGIELEQ